MASLAARQHLRLVDSSSVTCRRILSLDGLSEPRDSGSGVELTGHVGVYNLGVAREPVPHLGNGVDFKQSTVVSS